MSTPPCSITKTGWTQPGGDPCGEDHCQVNRCTNHLTSGLTCPDCLARTRDHLHRIVEAAALMLPEAIHCGINSEAANLAGPAPHPGTTRARWWQARQEASRRATHTNDDGTTYRDPDQFATLCEQLPHDDPHHPYAVLGRWEMTIREDYNNPSREPITITGSAAYLGRMLYRIANDPNQDFPILERDLRTCARHLDAVLRNNPQTERGAPCHLCAHGDFVKHYTEALGHYGKRDRAGYLLDPEGNRIPADEWRCTNCGATLSDTRYRQVVEASYVATADVLTIPDLATRTGIPSATLRRWASGEWRRGEWVDPALTPVGARNGRKTYRVDDALRLKAARDGKASGSVSTEGVA